MKKDNASRYTAYPDHSEPYHLEKHVEMHVPSLFGQMNKT